jgi:dihydropteroate synthase
VSPRLLGVVNVTPDSFSDGGHYAARDAAIAHAERLLDEGADVVDIGGESTRPGAPDVSVSEELRRVLPVVEGLLARRPAAEISVDTRKPEVARAAVAAGARWINDVGGATDPAMVEVMAEAGVGVILMHMRGTPQTMQADTRYDDLIGEVASFLEGRAAELVARGLPAGSVVLDPGLGFGKDPLANPTLIAALPTFRALGHPVLIGASRKAFIGRLTGVERAADRVFGSIGAALAAAEAGADWLRVHDVRATREALLVYRACRTEKK